MVKENNKHFEVQRVRCLKANAKQSRSNGIKWSAMYCCSATTELSYKLNGLNDSSVLWLIVNCSSRWGGHRQRKSEPLTWQVHAESQCHYRCKAARTAHFFRWQVSPWVIIPRQVSDWFGRQDVTLPNISVMTFNATQVFPAYCVFIA